MDTNPYESSHEVSVVPKPFRTFRWLALGASIVVLGIVIVGIAFTAVLPVRRNARPAAWRMQCSNNLKMIALAIREYEADHQSFPPAYTVDESGNRLHSWRVLVLPYLHEQALYDSIDLTKPWDDPVNAAVHSNIPAVFRCPVARNTESNETVYQAVVSAESSFPFDKPRLLSEITDGISDTVMLIETTPATAVHWMSPKDTDVEFVMGFGAESSFSHHGGTHAAFVDGSVRFLPRELAESTRRAIVSVDGGEEVSEASY